MSKQRPVAVITGGGSGLGLATARRLVDVDHAVLLAGRRGHVLERAAASLRAHRSDAVVDIIQADVGDPAAGSLIADRAQERLGGLDVLVAAAAGLALCPIVELDARSWNTTVDVVLKGTAFCAAAAARVMVASGGGRIILVSSVSAGAHDPKTAAYDAAKGGVNSLAGALAVELAPHGIAVNAISPGWMRIPATEEMLAAAGGESVMAQVNPLARMGEPDEVARVIEFLAVSAPEFLTGSVIAVDGGQAVMAPSLRHFFGGS